ncbi:hypothetical protein AAVH_07222 [Aphelenchoides avenae]|nr:hypothetical protein AAVH_27320 [Aphelenchus avenae]KAH7725175.1 hypothetical protein AAVH_07222 [Aphelenchus avenae]
MDARAKQLLAQAEKCRQDAKKVADEAEARRNRNLVSHDAVVGCAANLSLADRQVLRQVEHRKDGCSCYHIRARLRREEAQRREQQAKASEEANRAFIKACGRTMAVEDRKRSWGGKQPPVMAARRLSPVRFDPRLLKYGKMQRKTLREATQPTASGSRLLEDIIMGLDKTHG